MHLVHIAEPSIVLLLNDESDVERAWLVPRSYRPPSCVILLQGMIATAFGSPSIEDGYYHADGLACMRLLFWTSERRPNASPKALRNAFDRLFAEDPSDALKAVLRIYCGKKAPGEEVVSVRDQWARHPKEMLALAALGELRRRA